MTTHIVMNTNTRRVVGTHSFTDGFRPIARPRRPQREDDVLSHALWLQRNRGEEIAEEYLEDWIAGRNPSSIVA